MRKRGLIYRPAEFQLDSTHTLADGLLMALLGRWPGGYRVFDSAADIGRANHGTPVNVVPRDDWSYDPILRRNVLYYDGLTDYLVCGTTATDMPLTIACWVNVEYAGTIMFPLSLGCGTGTAGCYGLEITSGASSALALINTVGGGNFYATGTYPGCRQWVHLCGVFRSNVYRQIFVDGIPGASNSTNATVANPITLTTVGYKKVGTDLSYGMLGKIADPMVWNRELSDGEIAILARKHDVMYDGLLYVPRRSFWIMPSMELESSSSSTQISSESFSSSSTSSLVSTQSSSSSSTSSSSESSSEQRYWVNGVGGTWNDANNWAYFSNGPGGAGVPTASCDVYFDGNGLGACTVDANISIKSFTMASAYTSKIDFADSGYTVAVNGDVTFPTPVGLNPDLGDSRWTVQGSWINKDISYTTGMTLDLAGTGTVAILATWNSKLPTVTVSGTYSGVIYTAESFTITGSFTATGNCTQYGSRPNAFTVGPGATFAGSSTVTVNGDLVRDATCTWTHTGTLDIGEVGGTVHYIDPGTYTEATVEFDTAASSATIYFNAGNYVFNGNVQLAAVREGITINTTAATVNIEFRGDVLKGSDASAFTWTKGAGTITFAGSNNQSFDWGGVTLEDIIVNKSGGVLTFSNAKTCDSFTGTAGDCDLNGTTLTVTGDVTIHGDTGFRFWNGADADQSSAVIDYDGVLTLVGSAGSLLAIDDLDFVNSVADTPTATYCTVTNSNRTGAGSDIDATDGTNVDNGGNTGWDFDLSSSSSTSTSVSSSSSTSTSESSSSTSTLTSQTSQTSLSTLTSASAAEETSTATSETSLSTSSTLTSETSVSSSSTSTLTSQTSVSSSSTSTLTSQTSLSSPSSPSTATSQTSETSPSSLSATSASSSTSSTATSLTSQTSVSSSSSSSTATSQTSLSSSSTSTLTSVTSQTSVSSSSTSTLTSQTSVTSASSSSTSTLTSLTSQTSVSSPSSSSSSSTSTATSETSETTESTISGTSVSSSTTQTSETSVSSSSTTSTLSTQTSVSSSSTSTQTSQTSLTSVSSSTSTLSTQTSVSSSTSTSISSSSTSTLSTQTSETSLTSESSTSSTQTSLSSSSTTSQTSISSSSSTQTSETSVSSTSSESSSGGVIQPDAAAITDTRLSSAVASAAKTSTIVKRLPVH